MWISLTGLGEVFERLGSLLILLLNGIQGNKIMQIFSFPCLHDGSDDLQYYTVFGVIQRNVDIIP
jgi:hypothetical protein